MHAHSLLSVQPSAAAWTLACQARPPPNWHAYVPHYAISWCAPGSNVKLHAQKGEKRRVVPARSMLDCKKSGNTSDTSAAGSRCDAYSRLYSEKLHLASSLTLLSYARRAAHTPSSSRAAHRCDFLEFLCADHFFTQSALYMHSRGPLLRLVRLRNASKVLSCTFCSGGVVGHTAVNSCHTGDGCYLELRMHARMADAAANFIRTVSKHLERKLQCVLTRARHASRTTPIQNATCCFEYEFEYLN
jgi:hypothetical protein